MRMKIFFFETRGDLDQMRDSGTYSGLVLPPNSKLITVYGDNPASNMTIVSALSCEKDSV